MKQTTRKWVYPDTMPTWWFVTSAVLAAVIVGVLVGTFFLVVFGEL